MTGEYGLVDAYNPSKQYQPRPKKWIHELPINGWDNAEILKEYNYWIYSYYLGFKEWMFGKEYSSVGQKDEKKVQESYSHRDVLSN